MLILESGGARAVVDPEAGGRLASLVVAGRELLVTAGPDAFGWGSFPMAPWAGRIRHGRFRFDGREHRLPLGLPPHAIHGTVCHVPWRVLSGDSIGADLGDPWPFCGRVTQRFGLGADGLTVEMELVADEPMPATIGWHPWFRRELSPVEPGPEPARHPCLELDFEPRAMYRRDGEGIPTGELVPPGPHPWDDCFVDPVRPPVLRWPGALELTIDSSCPCLVVYEPASAVCVEPQTGPPDAANLGAAPVVPGTPLRAEMRWSWRLLD